MKYAKVLLLALFCVLFSGIAQANRLTDKPATIFYPEGHYLEGWPRKVGFDMFGYNYQAHKFQGYFANVYLGGDGLPPYGGNAEAYYQALVEYGYFETVGDAEAWLDGEWYWVLRNTKLRMFWNDAWLSNKDLADSSGGGAPDGALDRHYGFPSYFDSGAELIQYQVEPMQVVRNGEVKTENLYYYSQIIAVSSDDVLVDGIWYTPEGIELGPEVYGSFAKVKEVLHDPYTDGRSIGRQWGRRIRDAAF